MYTPSVDYLSTGEGCTLPPWIIYPLGRGVQFLRGLFIHCKGVYTSSVEYLSTGRGVHFLRVLFVQWGGLYTPSVDYLSTRLD